MRAATLSPVAPDAAVTELARARAALVEAHEATDHLLRFSAAHVAALRVAAAVLAVRARPSKPARRPQRNAWVLLAQVAPELGEWATLFAAGAPKRAAAEAGLSRAVTQREADDLVREAEAFCELVESLLGLGHQPALTETWRRAS
jgi:SAV_6107-like HEPN